MPAKRAGDAFEAVAGYARRSIEYTEWQLPGQRRPTLEHAVDLRSKLADSVLSRLAFDNGYVRFLSRTTMAERRRMSDQSVQLYRLPSRGRTVPAAQGHDCVVALRALGEDTRVRIVGLLIDVALDVGEISRRLCVSPYNVSKHLRILREAGLLDVKKNGRTRLYALPDTIRGAAEDSVLDLGCCRFQFQGGTKDLNHLAPAGPSRRRSGVQMCRRPSRTMKARA
jgi:DNA-binding transcriptional ArsR family regulator